MKRILIAAATALLSTAAQADPLDSAYGNTVTQLWPDGTKVTIFVNQDGTWESHTGASVEKGTFVWKDATHVCFTTTDPPSNATGCTEFKVDHKVGETWIDPTDDGRTVTMTITAGRT